MPIWTLRNHAYAFITAVAVISAFCTTLPAVAEDETIEPPAEIVAYITADVPGFADAEAIQAALIDAGDNWRELAEALNAVLPGASQPWDDVDYLNMSWLIEGAPHLDRLELTTAILVNNVTLANTAAAHFGYDRDSDFFRRYVLNYRLDLEPTTPWRSELNRRYAGGENSVATIAERVGAGFNEQKRGYYGNLADPVSVDNARAGSKRELAILMAAALRSQGWGTRFVSENRTGESWVEVYVGDAVEYDAAQWSPVYPLQPERSGDASYALELCEGWIALVTAGDAFGREQVTSRYSDVCAVRPKFQSAGEDAEDFEHWSICAWEGGYYKALDDLGYPHSDVDVDDEDEDDVYFLGAPGEYRLECGVRYPGGFVHVQVRDFTAEPEGEVALTLSLDAPADLPLSALAERTVEWPQDGDAAASGNHLIVIYDDAEPSVRALELLGHYKDDPRMEYMALRADIDDDGKREWISSDLKVSENDSLPVVILVIDGETVLYRRGYDLSVGDWVERALIVVSDVP